MTRLFESDPNRGKVLVSLKDLKKVLDEEVLCYHEGKWEGYNNIALKLGFSPLQIGTNTKQGE